MEKYSYWATLKKSFTTLVKHPKIFVPLLIMFLFNLALAPFYGYLVFFSLTSIFILLVLYPVILFIMFIVYGWIFAIVRQIVIVKKVSLKISFKESFRMAWKLFVVSLLLLVFLIVFYIILILLVFVGGLLWVLLSQLSVVLAYIIIGFIILLLLIFCFVLFAILMHLTPLIILENKDPWETLKSTWAYFMSHKTHSLKMALIATILLFISYIPYLIFWLSIGVKELALFMLENPTLYYVYTILLSLPGMVLFLAVLLFYVFSYRK